MSSVTQQASPHQSGLSVDLPESGTATRLHPGPNISPDIPLIRSSTSYPGKKRTRTPASGYPRKKQKQQDEPEDADEDDSSGLEMIPADPQAVHTAREREIAADLAFAEASKDPENSTVTIRTGAQSETVTMAYIFRKVFNLQENDTVRHQDGRYRVVPKDQDQAFEAPSPRATGSGASTKATGAKGGPKEPIDTSNNQGPGRRITRSAATRATAASVGTGRAAGITRAAAARAGPNVSTASAQHASEQDSSATVAPAPAQTGRVTRSTTARSAAAAIISNTIGQTAMSNQSPGTTQPAATIQLSVTSQTSGSTQIPAATQGALTTQAQAAAQTATQATTTAATPPGILAANPQYVVNNPRAAGVNLPTDNTHTTLVWTPYPNAVNWTDPQSVTALNRWRHQKIRRRTGRLGTKTDGRSR